MTPRSKMLAYVSSCATSVDFYASRASAKSEIPVKTFKNSEAEILLAKSPSTWSTEDAVGGRVDAPAAGVPRWELWGISAARRCESRTHIVPEIHQLLRRKPVKEGQVDEWVLRCRMVGVHAPFVGGTGRWWWSKGKAKMGIAVQTVHVAIPGPKWATHFYKRQVNLVLLLPPSKLVCGKPGFSRPKPTAQMIDAANI
ncbi:hypothetical protein C8F04DRAFT_1184448 [Mycena alexandri]|uniref:Uncharacterized protein n=1 Tax=Mycena alexandri TaxID=1745969 RepID=A0AAD6SUM5_9AGAR|nr:hypothetical protein C8F04DRAFT_1184448 [Mycena alexandri]